MRRIKISSLAISGLILVTFFAVVSRGVASSPPATLRAISITDPASSNGLQLRIDGGYSFSVVQATPDTLFIDLTPATAGQIARKGEWSGGLLTGYSLMQYFDSANQPVVRVQLEMKHHQAYKVQRTNEALTINFGDNPATTSSASAAESSAAPKILLEAPKVADAKVPSVKTSAGLTEVSAVSISAGPDGKVFVDIATTQPASYRVIQMSNPKRLVLDLDKAHQSLRQKTFTVQSALLNEVRVGQFREKNPSVVRVVADLSGDPIFDVHSQAGGIRIELKPHASGVQPRVNKSSVDGSGQQTATANAEPMVAPQTVAKSENIKPVNSEYQNVLPAASGSNEVTAAPRSTASEEAPEALQAANAAKVLAGSTESNTEAAQGQNPGGTASSSDQVHYTGEPISVNLKDVDLKDFFRLIHEISGLNILVDPNVTGTVTLVLDNVPWDQALDIVLKNNQLGKTLEGNVLRISRLETLAAQQEQANKLIAAREDAQPLVTNFVRTNYAKALDIQRILKAWVGGGALTKRGSVLVDERDNTLIISDIASQIPIILSIISKLDIKSKQVSIEAQVVVASKTFERDLQGALNNGIRNRSGSVLTGGTVGSTATAQGTIPTTIPNPTGPSNLLGQTSTAGFGSFVINNLGATYFLSAMISAAEITGQAKTISKPIIVTQNNILATVIQGVQIPIQTNINNTITIQYVAAALTLTVTPQVTGDGNIFMIIKVDNSSVGSILSGAGPSINTQSATTQVLVPDGGTVIFGGVTVNGQNQSATYVPWIGQVPIIGRLFKTSSRTTNDSQLLFFVTPKILPG